MVKTRLTEKPKAFKIEEVRGYYGISIYANAERLESEEGEFWQADYNFFWELKENIDLEAVKSNPEAFLFYVPVSKRNAGKEKAQAMLDDLRNGCPHIPVGSYKVGAKVCNRPADQIKLLAGIQLGGLPYYELASGEIVSLTVEDLQKIAIDLTTAETAMQQAKQACWNAIEQAKGEEDIEAALDDFSAILDNYR